MPLTLAETSEFRSSDLSRSSPEVFAAASDHPVRVTRRDGEALVMMSEAHDHARQRLLELAGQLITVSTDTDGTLSARLAKAFPWMLALSKEDRDECAREVLDSARASFSTKQPHLAIAALTSWEETAIAIAAGLNDEPVEWLEESVDVDRP